MKKKSLGSKPKMRAPGAVRDYASPGQDWLRKLEPVLSTTRGSAKAVGCSHGWIMLWRRGAIALKPEQVHKLTVLVTCRLAELNGYLANAAL